MIGLLEARAPQGAVVVGAGTGRLSMAGAVAKHFERVEVLERNRLTRGAAHFTEQLILGAAAAGAADLMAFHLVNRLSDDASRRMQPFWHPPGCQWVLIVPPLQ
jgi:phytoene dehydrogenase-like protein